MTYIPFPWKHEGQRYSSVYSPLLNDAKSIKDEQKKETSLTKVRQLPWNKLLQLSRPTQYQTLFTWR